MWTIPEADEVKSVVDREDLYSPPRGPQGNKGEDVVVMQSVIDELVELKQNGKGQGLSFEIVSASPEWVEVLVPCELQAAERAHEFFIRMLGDLSEETRDAVGLALRELLFNAVEWGGRCNSDCKVRVACVRGRGIVTFRIADPGPGFSFSGLSHSALNNPQSCPHEHMSARQQQGLRPGGFGIMLARAMVDELNYNETQNEVQFVKYLR